MIAKSVSNMLIVDLRLLTAEQEGQALSSKACQMVTLDHLHLCIGHISVDQLKVVVLATSDIIVNMGSELSSCTTCIWAKQHKKAISCGLALCSNTPMALIHSNICGLFPTQLFTGKTYFISFIDNFSHHATVYFLKEKSEVLTWLQDFLTLLPDQWHVWTLWLDHGGEYIGHEVQALLHSKGITHALSPPYTPQYNRVAKQFNHSIMEMARALLFSSKLPCSFWARRQSPLLYTATTADPIV
jgi:hypothetical protein